MNMIQLVGFSGRCGLLEIPIKGLVAGQMYLTAEITQDDEGEQSAHYDVALCFEDQVPGDVKIAKLMRFLQGNKTKRFSDLPGVHYYGPITVAVTKLVEEPV